MKTLKNWIQNLLLMVAGVLVGLLILETFAITTGIAVTQSQTQIFYHLIEPDAQLGYKPKSNIRDFKAVWKKARVAEVISTDSYGFRNLGKDYAKSNLYFIGDSFTWGQWVDLEKTFPRLVESALNESVINLSAPGYSFAQYEILFDDWIVKYKPNIVALCIFANDLINYSPDIGKYIYNSIKARGFLPWYEKSFLYQFILKNNKKGSQISVRNRISKKAKNGLNLFNLSLLKSGGAAADKDYLTSGAVEKVEAALSRIIDLSQKNNVKLFVFLIPSKESANITDYVQIFPDSVALLKIEEIGYQRLCDLAESKEVTCVNITEVFRKNSVQEKLYFDIDGHWNSAGHKLGAKVILDTLQHHS
ncbi:hypothetical protein NIES4075_63900 [Tolypothrix sp. NIES-4075]|uniref:SGNH/GDSL hydrolase family protein n=1 Tax=Tolypothrix sp. NIES-4075 TaxID=2005459 RepID=UPI000B67DEE3|nr:SGNH/GDSL hydrolase family protein [Tolypothrix sp. NIES-4075]GAX45369.1 hypothetical protein NIES4075_63900 [Tolypothrix sp. NIES-4075]